MGSSNRKFAPAAASGQVLLAVIAVATVMALAMASFGLFVTLHTRDKRSQLGEAQALYIAEAALQRTIGHLQGQNNWKTAPLPSPNPLSLPDPTNQARVSYLSQSKKSITVQAEGYILSSGYTLPSASPPPFEKVRARATLQVTLNKVPTGSIWNYVAYADNRQYYAAVAHGSVFAKRNDILVGNNEAVYNDFSYSASLTPSWLQDYLNSLNPANLKASVKAYNGNISISGTGKLGTVANPLSSVGVNAPKTVNVSNYYNLLTTVSNPPSYPQISNNQLNGIVLPLTEYDYRYVAGDILDPNNGCVWDDDLTTNASRGMSITFGGDAPSPSCTPYGTNGIAWQPGNSKLIVNGTIFVDGDLTIGDSTYPDITYEGRGLIVVNGTVTINAGLHPQNMADLPATALLGIATQDDITITPPATTPYKVVAGTFYSGNNVTINQNTILVGAVCADSNVTTSGLPVLYHVPGLANNLLPGTPDNSGPEFIITVSNWKLLV